MQKFLGQPWIWFIHHRSFRGDTQFRSNVLAFRKTLAKDFPAPREDGSRGRVPSMVALYQLLMEVGDRIFRPLANHVPACTKSYAL